MRLLFINYEFPPLGGGAAYASLATARELVALGHRVDFLTAACRGDPAHDEIDGIGVHRVPAYRHGVHESGLLGAASFIASAAYRLRGLLRSQHYDVHHYYFGLPTGLLSVLPGRQGAQPYVVSLRGSDVPGYDPALRLLHRGIWPVTHRIWRRAFRLVANSGDLRRLALQSAPDIPIEVISNGATVVSGAVPAARPDQAPVRILTVCRLIPRKSVETLIIALSKARDRTLQLDVAGEGPQGRSLLALARELKVDERVRFHGYVGPEGLARLRASADIFVLTSLSESCSMALLEAMAQGIAPIATRVGGTRELIEHGHNGLLTSPRDADELSQALNLLAADRELRARLARASRNLVAERYSWHMMARKYEALFEAAARDSQAAR